MIKAYLINGDAGDFSQAAAIRRAVFGDDPSCGLDASDANSVHVLAFDGLAPCATGRLHPEPRGWRIGRVAVLDSHRNQGYGDLVVRMLLLRAVETYADADIYVLAAPHAQKFYERYGFAFVADVFEHGAPRKEMRINGNDVALSCGGAQGKARQSVDTLPE